MWYKGFDGRHRDRPNDALMERESEQLKLLMERQRDNSERLTKWSFHGERFKEQLKLSLERQTDRQFR
jgi:hypothetical protein